MTPAEAAALLGVAAAFDNRKPDETAAQAWAMALNGLRFEDCRDAIVAHYRKTDVWLMPSEVRREVVRIRGDRWAKRPLVTPPASIDPDDVPALRAWEANFYRRVCDGEDVAPIPELPPSDADRELFRRLADEVDAYLAPSTAAPDLFGGASEQGVAS